MLGNINLFLNKLSVEEIAKLDTNKDGQISNEEAEGSLFQFKDRFSDTEYLSLTGSAKPVEQQPAANVPTTSSEVPETAKNAVELRTYFTKMKDSFIETYVAGLLESGELEESGKKSLIFYINTNARTYIEDYIKNNVKTPYDTSEVYAGFETYIAEKLEERKAAQAAVDTQLTDAVNNTDANYEKLTEATKKADAEYITSEEYAEIKGIATDYILGIMAGGLENDEFDAFMSALNPEYKNDTNYKVAQKALELLQTETDPIKMQEIINNAKTAIGNLIGDMDEYGDGTTPLSEAVKTRAKFIDNKKYSEQLDAYIDDSIEARTHEPNPELFDPEARLERLNALKTAFLSQYEGDGTDLETEFAAFVEKSDKELENVYAKEDVLTESDTKNYEKIKETLEAAGQYANAEEKDAIFDAAADYVMANIVQGKTDSLLASINSQYVYFPQYIEAKSLLDNLKTSATPEADYTKAKELIKELLASQGVDKIEKFVEIEETKNVNLSVTEMTQGLWGYGTTETHGGDNLVGTHFTIQNGKVVWTNDTDNKDINKMYDQLRQRIHTQMKEQLGDSYNAEEIDKYFDQAIVNVAMNLENPTGLHSIEELANNAVVYFNAIATAGIHGQETNKTSNNKIDMQTVLLNTGKIDKYCSPIKWTLGGARMQIALYLRVMDAEIINTFKAQLGDKFDEVEINRIIQEARGAAVDAFSSLSSVEGKSMDVVYKYYFEYLNNAYNNYLNQKGITL
ncbi:MAG: hypothetical protein ACLSUS_00905 [Opitutales bacterium]